MGDSSWCRGGGTYLTPPVCMYVCKCERTHERTHARTHTHAPLSFRVTSARAHTCTHAHPCHSELQAHRPPSLHARTDTRTHTRTHAHHPTIRAPKSVNKFALVHLRWQVCGVGVDGEGCVCMHKCMYACVCVWGGDRWVPDSYSA